MWWLVDRRCLIGDGFHFIHGLIDFDRCINLKVEPEAGVVSNGSGHQKEREGDHCHITLSCHVTSCHVMSCQDSTR